MSHQDILIKSWELILIHDYQRIYLVNIDKTQFKSTNANLFLLLSIDDVINKYPEIKSYLNDDLVVALHDVVQLSIELTDGEKLEQLKIKLGSIHLELLMTWIDNFLIVMEDVLQDKVSIDQLQLWKTNLCLTINAIHGAKTDRMRKGLTQIFDKKKSNDSMKKPWDALLLKKLSPESIQLTNEDLKKMLSGSNRKNDPITIFHFKFYDLLFKKDPTLAAMFPDEATQRKAFTRMIDAMITKSHKIEENSYFFKKLGRRHLEEYQVERKQLEAFADSLMETFEIILEDDFGFTAKRAWKNSLQLIVNMMVDGSAEKESRPRTLSHESTEQVSQMEQRNMRRSWELVKNMNLDPKRLKFKTYDMKVLFDKISTPSNLEYFTLKMYDNLFFETPGLRYYFNDQSSLIRMFDGLFDVILIKFEHSRDFNTYAKNLGRIHMEQHKLPATLFTKIKDSTIKTLQEFLLDKLSANLLKSWKTCIECIIQLMAEGQKEVKSDEEDNFTELVVSQFSNDKLELIRKSWSSILSKTIQLSSFKLKCSDHPLLLNVNKAELKMYSIFCIKYFDNLLWEFPELSILYNDAEKQKKEFDSCLFTITEKLEYIEYYEDKIREQGKRVFESTDMKPDYYSYQSKILIATLKEFLGNDFDMVTKLSWKEALDQVNNYLIEGPKTRRRTETNSMLKNQKSTMNSKVSPLQVRLINRSWEKILTLKLDTKTIKLKHFPVDTLDYQKNPTTIFSYIYYDNLFTDDKEFIKCFPDIMTQSKAFGGLISLVIKKLDNLEENEEKIKEIGKQFEECGVRLEHLPKIVQNMIQALSIILGNEFDIETEDAWFSGLLIIVEMMMDVSKKKSRRLSENMDSMNRARLKTADIKLLSSLDVGLKKGTSEVSINSKESTISLRPDSIKM